MIGSCNMTNGCTMPMQCVCCCRPQNCPTQNDNCCCNNCGCNNCGDSCACNNCGCNSGGCNSGGGIFGFCDNNTCCGCAGELVNAIIGITILQSILALIFGGFMGNLGPTGPS